MDMVLYALLKKQIASMGVTDDKLKEVVSEFLLEHPEYIGATEEQVEQINQNTEDCDILYKTLYGIKKGTDPYPSSMIYSPNVEYTAPTNLTLFFKTIPAHVTLNGQQITVNEREYTVPQPGTMVLDQAGYTFRGIAFDILDYINKYAISRMPGNIIEQKSDGIYVTINDITENDIKKLFGEE